MTDGIQQPGSFRIVRYGTVSSTNDKAFELARSGAAEFTVAAAESQTSGRGRNGAAWVSPPGCGAYMSMILRPSSLVSETPFFSITAGVASCEAIASLSGLPAFIKWPNDVLAGGHKVCGILCEADIGAPGCGSVVVAGTGVNVNTPPQFLPERPLFPASSLYVESGGRLFDIDRMISLWAESMVKWTEITRLPDGRKRVAEEWNRRSFFNGRDICIQTQDSGAISGICRGIDETGMLLVEMQNGGIKEIISGSVVCSPERTYARRMFSEIAASGKPPPPEVRLAEVSDRSASLAGMLTDVWERSVRATHLFLGETDISEIRAEVPSAISKVPHLVAAFRTDDGAPAGFMGISGNSLEMLFISPEMRGRGLGRLFVEYALKNFSVTETTVNEQNPQAVGFYEHMGFRVRSRTETDGDGRPFPILYMSLVPEEGA